MASCVGSLIVHYDDTLAGCTQDDEPEGVPAATCGMKARRSAAPCGRSQVATIAAPTHNRRSRGRASEDSVKGGERLGGGACAQPEPESLSCISKFVAVWCVEAFDARLSVEPRGVALGASEHERR